MQTEHILLYVQLVAGGAMFPNVPSSPLSDAPELAEANVAGLAESDSPLSDAPELAEADVSAGHAPLGSWASLMTTETINSCLSVSVEGMAIKRSGTSGTQRPTSTVERDRSRSPPGRAPRPAHQGQRLFDVPPQSSFRSSWTQWPGYSRINVGGPMEEIFVPHQLKLWANWKNRSWSIMSLPDMHASDWKDEGLAVHHCGEDAEVRAEHAEHAGVRFRSSWTQWPGYSRINVGGNGVDSMESIFVPHWNLKLWANWKGRHWSIRSSLGMHASDWTDEGSSQNPLGEDGASSVNRSGH